MAKSEPVYAPDGTRLKYQELRQTTYYSINQLQCHLCFSLLGLLQTHYILKLHQKPLPLQSVVRDLW